MSDPNQQRGAAIARLEQKNAQQQQQQQRQYSESAGLLLGTAPDPSPFGAGAPSPALSPASLRPAAPRDDEGLLPVMIENGLERIGALKHVQRLLLPTGQIKYPFARCLLAEFMGTLLFQIFGGAAPPKDTTAPAANGFALVAVVYAFCNISGGHLNPAVTFALTCTGHMMVWKGFCYAAAQILGSIFGSLIYTGLIPGLSIAQKDFHGGLAPGCFGPAPGVTPAALFGWESLMTFLLVLTVYAAAVTKPGHGNAAPLAIGLSLYAAALTGGPFTGASLNPARTIGPACVFACNVRVSFLYIASELFGAALAAGLSIFLYGRAPVGRAAAAAAILPGAEAEAQAAAAAAAQAAGESAARARLGPSRPLPLHPLRPLRSDE